MADDEVFDDQVMDEPGEEEEGEEEEEITAAAGSGATGAAAVFDFDDSSQTSSREYEIFTADQVRSHAASLVREVRDTLKIPEADALALLHANKFRKERLLDTFFSSETAPAASAPAAAQTGDTVPCPICMDDVPASDSLSLSCGHRFCLTCWGNYVRGKFGEGSTACTSAKCMAPKCSAPCGADLFRRFLAPADIGKYDRFCIDAVVASMPNCKWCPRAGCETAIQAPLCYIKPVHCRCGFVFCFECCDAEIGDHAPCDCAMAAEWNRKSADESENVTWLTANTKKCPKCRSHIEKNGGCMHMTCRKCTHEFCWLCRADWRGHSACNKVEAEKIEREQSKAKTELEHYLQYFHRYESYKNAMKLASQQLQVANERGDKMITKFNLQSEDVAFLRSAVECLLRNRNMLQYSYVFAYYVSKSPKLATAPERNLFEFLQKDLEAHTDRLGETYEREDPESHDDFIKWRELVSNYTRISTKFRDRFIEGVIGKSLISCDALLPAAATRSLKDREKELAEARKILDAPPSATHESPPSPKQRRFEFPPAPFRAHPPPPGTTLFGSAPAFGAPTLGAPVVGGPRVAPEVQYAAQLEQLASMGFTDRTMTLPLLIQNKGDVDAVMAVIFG